MILSKQKPMEEVLGYLEGEKNVFVIGCNGCAQASGTGGHEQVEEMRGRLKEAGKNVTGSLVVDFLCEKALVKSKLRPRTEQVEAADSILVMTCGVGVQAVAAAVNKLCHPACDTVNMGGTRGEWQGSERCAECGECMLDYTGGICPLTACTKGLLSGQCGGASHGKCEVNPERDCGWELIYNRLKALGRTDKLKVFVAPKDYSRMAPDYKMMSTSKWALERTDEKESA
jgi:hypothetical protein